jgi:hypothetical protein
MADVANQISLTSLDQCSKQGLLARTGLLDLAQLPSAPSHEASSSPKSSAQDLDRETIVLILTEELKGEYAACNPVFQKMWSLSGTSIREDLQKIYRESRDACLGSLPPPVVEKLTAIEKQRESHQGKPYVSLVELDIAALRAHIARTSCEVKASYDLVTRLREARSASPSK